MIHFDFLHLFIIINSEMILRKFIAEKRPCSKEREKAKVSISPRRSSIYALLNESTFVSAPLLEQIHAPSV